MTVPNRRPVIVGVDGSPASFGAVRWAADEAIRHDQPLRIIHAVQAHGPVEEIADDHGLAIQAAAEIRRWQPGLHVTPATWHGEPARVLVEQSRYASLVVVGSRGYGGFHALMLGSVGMHLAGHAHCPILVVHRAERWAGPETPMPQHRPVVVGADGSVGAEFTLALAFSEAADRGVPLTAVRAWREPQPHRGHIADVAELAASATRELTTELQPWRSKFPGVHVEARVRRGTAVPILLEETQDALMVVLGARGEGGFAGLQLGAVTHQVLEHATAPVLIARHIGGNSS